MVHQMIEKFNECRIGNNGTVMATRDMQQPTSEKKLMDLPIEEAGSTVPITPGNSSHLIKDRGAGSDSTKVSGIKRQQTSYPSSPARSQPTNAGSTNGHLVYVRRKIETESAKTDSSHSVVTKKTTSSCNSDPKLQPESVVPEVTASSPIPAALTSLSPILPYPPPGKPPITELPAVPEPNYSTVTTAVPVQPEEKQSQPEVPPIQQPDPPERAHHNRVPPVQPEPQRQRNQHCKERFLRLQMYLKSCDESSQEEYIQKLRSLSAAGRSKHAYELEKRAIQLLLEEGKELHRMRFLNVLGKALPDGQPSVSSTQIHSVD